MGKNINNKSFGFENVVVIWKKTEVGKLVVELQNVVTCNFDRDFIAKYWTNLYQTGWIGFADVWALPSDVFFWVSPYENYIFVLRFLKIELLRKSNYN